MSKSKKENEKAQKIINELNNNGAYITHLKSLVNERSIAIDLQNNVFYIFEYSNGFNQIAIPLKDIITCESSYVKARKQTSTETEYTHLFLYVIAEKPDYETHKLCFLDTQDLGMEVDDGISKDYFDSKIKEANEWKDRILKGSYNSKIKAKL